MPDHFPTELYRSDHFPIVLELGPGDGAVLAVRPDEQGLPPMRVMYAEGLESPAAYDPVHEPIRGRADAPAPATITRHAHDARGRLRYRFRG